MIRSASRSRGDYTTTREHSRSLSGSDARLAAVDRCTQVAIAERGMFMFTL
jgi:hypothetical protein